MAKRKKAKTHRRRRRVGALALNAANPIIKFGIPLLGYFFADKIQAPIDKAVGDKLDGKIVGAAEAGLGALIVLGKKKRSLPVTIIGGLLLGAGAKKLMGEMGVAGIGNTYGRVPVIGNTYGRVPVLSGYSPNASLNGYTPNQALNGRVRHSGRMMAGVSTASGSTLSNQPGSNMMN